MGENLYNSSDLPPARALGQMLDGFWVTQLLGVAVRLGLADQLQSGPKSAQELAHLTRVDGKALNRLMRGLVAIGVFSQLQDGRFDLTPTGYYLRSEIPESLTPQVRFWTEDWVQHGWGKLLYSIKTGKPGFPRALQGKNMFEYLAQRPEARQVFDEQFVQRMRVIAKSVVDELDFSQCRLIVDVGGGYGTLLQAILLANPRPQGIIFDLSSVCEEAKLSIKNAGLESRCEVVSGDFFQSVPSGGDLYLLSAILHSWNDMQCVQILNKCCQAIDSKGRLLIIEATIPEIGQPSFETTMQDISMMVETGGRERSQAEYHALLSAAGFIHRSSSILRESAISIIEAVPAAN